jgi:predicted NodU family carbamoyl transferase
LKPEDFDLVRVAQLLAKGNVLGTIRGKLEIGPRALGNRSYLSSPIMEGMKDRINLMKGREFWRPVAPIVLAEDYEKYFITKQLSPYMSFAPKVKDKYAIILNEIIHLDGTARVQTVSSSDGWIYQLLQEFKKITGFGILMNTSFNKKGEPLINDEKDALSILESTNLDGIVTKNLIILK